jgi:8-oxo-dGTP diphosphatase
MIKTVSNRKRVKLAPKFVTNEIAINCIVFGYVGGNLKVLMVKEENDGENKWRLPATFMKKNETANDATQRLLQESGIKESIFLSQLNAHCDPNRMITIGHYALIDTEKYSINKSTMSWIKISYIQQLFYNQNAIFEEALMRLKRMVQDTPIAIKLLPRKFALPELMNLYEAILGVEIDKPNLRKKILGSKYVLQLNEKSYSFTYRSTKLYTLNLAVFNSYDSKIADYDF